MRSPAIALLWESWRVTRYEFLLRIAYMLAIGGVAVGVSRVFVDAADIIATVALLMLLIIGSFSTASLSAFPFRLGFVRPIPTWVLVAVPMLFVSIGSAFVYVIPVTILNSLTDTPFPVFPAAALVALVVVLFAASSWWSNNHTARAATHVLVFGMGYLLFASLGPERLPGNDFPPSRWVILFNFSLADYAAAKNVLKRIVAHADGWLPNRITPGDLEVRRRELDELARAAGRDPESITISVYGQQPDPALVRSLIDAGAYRVVVRPNHVDTEAEMGAQLEGIAEALF